MDDVERKPALYQRLKSNMSLLGSQIKSLVGLAGKKISNKNEDNGRFKGLILNVLRNRTSKPDPIEEDATLDEQSLVDELVQEHNNLHPDLKIEQEEKKKKVQNNMSLVAKLISMQSQDGNEVFQGEILMDFQKLIENFETLPEQVQHIFHTCKNKEMIDSNELECKEESLKNKTH